MLDPHPLLPWLTRPVRAWLYRVAVSVAVLGEAYGLVGDHPVPRWLGVVAAVLGVGTAAAYTSTHSPADTDDRLA